MRLPPLPPDELSPELRTLHDAIASRMGQSLSAVVSQDDRGALLGPFPPLLHFPKFGQPAFAFLNTLVGGAKLPKAVREIAILVVGARFNARYELYSHERMAALAKLSPATIAALAAGQRPPELSEMEAAACDFTAASLTAGAIPDSTYARAMQLFGKDGVGELVFLIGGYSLICILLNAFDTPVPEGA